VLVLLPLRVFLVTFWLRPQECPGCGLPLSGVRSPLMKPWRHWVKGGYLCGSCGCETDLARRKGVPGPRPGLLVLGFLLMSPLVPAGGALFASPRASRSSHAIRPFRSATVSCMVATNPRTGQVSRADGRVEGAGVLQGEGAVLCLS
jgi:hypothetical protein